MVTKFSKTAPPIPAPPAAVQRRPRIRSRATAAPKAAPMIAVTRTVVFTSVPLPSACPTWIGVRTFCPLSLVTATDRRSAPSNLTRQVPLEADGRLSPTCRCQWVCRARSLLKGLRCGAPTRDSAPLTVILNGKEPAPLDGPPALIAAARCRRPRNGERPHTQGSEASCLASTSRAAGLPPEGCGFCRRHRRGTVPTHSPLKTRWSRSRWLAHSSPARAGVPKERPENA
jgi:hypothetical protein